MNAAAGVAMLQVIARGEVQKQTEAIAERLVAGLHSQIEKRGIEGCAFNTASVIHLHIGKCQQCDRALCLDANKSMAPAVAGALDMHLILNGVQFLRGYTGFISTAHTEEDIAGTVKAFGASLDEMIPDGVIAPSIWA